MRWICEGMAIGENMESITRQARGARSKGNAEYRSGRVRYGIGSAVGERTSTKHTRIRIIVFMRHATMFQASGFELVSTTTSMSVLVGISSGIST